MGNDERIRQLLAQGFEFCLSGRTRDAVDAWEQVLRLDPGNQRAREFLQAVLVGSPPGEPPSAPRARPAAPARPLAAAPAPSEVDRLLEDARRRRALDDFSGALEVLERALALDPSRTDAAALYGECVEALTRMYESRIGSMEGVPELAVRPDELIWLNLDHRAGFVLSQIDGQISFDDVLAVCGMTRLETARILATLLGDKVIRVKS